MECVIYLFNTNIPFMATPRKANPKKGGRPKEYNEKWHPKQVRYIAYLGYNNREIMTFFDITDQTFYRWLKEYPKFSDAINTGRYEDIQLVSKSLTKRATGYTYREVKKVITPAHKRIDLVPDPEKPGELKEVEVSVPATVAEIVETTKTLPPDVGAARFVLTNRDAAHWREAAHIDHTTNGKDLDGAKMDLSKLNDEQIKTLAELEAIAMGKKPQP